MFDVKERSLNVDVVKTLLQHNTNFCIESKIIRRGKLLLYNITDYHVKFSIKTNKNLLKVFEVPYPFHVSEQNGSVVFSYRLQDLCGGNTCRMEDMSLVEQQGVNKFYDKRLIINNLDV